jgi:aminoglycoside phosphotransferase (APT) family kinase protein
MAHQTAEINETLVRALIADQFPQWAELSIQPVSQGGWDNRTFLVGNEMVARLPSAAEYEAQVHREQRWLPHLRTYLPVEIPEPLALGQPGCGFLWAWSVYRWIPGATAAISPPTDSSQFATDLAAFLNALHRAPAKDGPAPGRENFFRGGDLAVYDQQLRKAVTSMASRIDTAAALEVWSVALASSWSERPVWVHGDYSLGNLLVRQGKLAAVIDFGQLCAGDPACDLAIAWTYLRGKDRATFLNQVAVDSETRERGCAWALWKAAIVAAGLVQTNAVEGQVAWQTIGEILADHSRTEASQETPSK